MKLPPGAIVRVPEVEGPAAFGAFSVLFWFFEEDLKLLSFPPGKVADSSSESLLYPVTKNKWVDQF